MVKLTEQIIRGKTRLERMSEIKNLNLWGQTLDDVSVLAAVPNLEVLSLSVNSIDSLKDFQNCHSLVELYLRKNEISNIADVRYLAGLRNLKTLWLGENPCASHPLYRLIVARALPGLEKLDNTDITPGERDQAMACAEAGQILGLTGGGPESPSYSPAQSAPYDAGPPAYNPVGVGSMVGGGYGGPPGPMSPIRQSMNQMNLGGGVPAVSPGRSPGGPRKSMLYAIMALLPELGEDDLVYVRRELDQILGSIGR